jgi:alanine racemase
MIDALSPDALIPEPLSSVEIDAAALQRNVEALRAAAPGERPRKLCVMVKGNAYGHGTRVAARAFAAAGVHWLGIGELAEAAELRAAGISLPTYCVCPVIPAQAQHAVALDVRVNVCGQALVEALSSAAANQSKQARVHIKLETGTNRQGVDLAKATALARRVVADPNLLLEGCSTHFADIEDTTDHAFARRQLSRFHEAIAAVRDVLSQHGREPGDLLAHASNTAAVLLWPDVHGDLLRFGIGAYGMWPSKETFVSAQTLGRGRIELQPALRWKTLIAQLKDVEAGQWVGYGRTFRTVRATRLGILPVGYYDGYDRGLSNVSEVLVAGQRARVVGRVAMNMVAIDVTDNQHAQEGSEVVLLGDQAGESGSDRITTTEMAGWLGTIHYEVTTRINPRLPRVVV